MALDRVEDPFWEQHPDWLARARTAIECALDRLAAVPPYDPNSPWMVDPDEPDYVDREHLKPRLRTLLARLLSPSGRTRG